MEAQPHKIGPYIIVVKLDGHPSLSPYAKHLLGAEPLHDLSVVARTQDPPAAPVATIWPKALWPMNY